MFGMTEGRSWEYTKNIIAYILEVCRKRKFLTILTHLKNKISICIILYANTALCYLLCTALLQLTDKHESSFVDISQLCQRQTEIVSNGNMLYELRLYQNSYIDFNLIPIVQRKAVIHPWDFPGKSTGVECHCLLLHSTQYTINKYLLKKGKNQSLKQSKRHNLQH